MIAIYARGQSNPRGHHGATGGDQSIPAGAMQWNNGEEAYGDEFIPMAWGQYPTDRGNSMPLAFCRRVMEVLSDQTYLLTVAKGGHPLEAFIRKATREANGWTIPPGKISLAHFVYNATLGARAALNAAGKATFDVMMGHQGEANQTNVPSGYRYRLLAELDDLLDTGLITETTPVILGGLYEGHAFYEGHKTAIGWVSAVRPQVVYVDSAGLAAQADGVHFTGPSVVELGIRMADAYLALG